MSVLVLDKEVFEKIYVKIIDYTHQKQCDINYCYIFSGFDENKAKGFIENILYLNELSWIKYHGEKGEKPNMFSSLNLKYKGESISSVQMYKYLQCIQYNIELHTIQTGYNGTENNKIDQDKLDSYELLVQAIASIADSIIKFKTNYEALKWSAA